jgi:integrase
MARPPRPPHELRLRNHHGRAVCTYRGTVYHFGAWDALADAPTPEALSAFREQQDRWAGDPAATPAGAAGEGEPLAAVWAAWLKTPHAPRDRRGDNRRAGVELFGTSIAPGPFRGLTADKLTAAAVLAWQDSLCARGLSRYTVGRLVGFLRRCLAWGRVAGLVPAGVVADVGLVPPPPPDATPRPKVRRGVTWEQVADVCGRLRSGTAADFLRVLWFTGARPSELARVTVGMVRRAGRVMPEKGEAVVLGRCWAADFGRDSKTGEERCLFFGPQAQAVLARHLAGRKAGEFVFRTRNGRPYTYRALSDAIGRACGHYKGKRGEGRAKPAGVWTVYQLRHAAAERVQSHYSGRVPGAGRLAAQAFLGHVIKGVTSGYSGHDWTTAEKVAFELG